jgi:hypothetical protein
MGDNRISGAMWWWWCYVVTPINLTFTPQAHTRTHTHKRTSAAKSQMRGITHVLTHASTLPLAVWCTEAAWEVAAPNVNSQELRFCASEEPTAPEHRHVSDGAGSAALSPRAQASILQPGLSVAGVDGRPSVACSEAPSEGAAMRVYKFAGVVLTFNPLFTKEKEPKTSKSSSARWAA